MASLAATATEMKVTTTNKISHNIIQNMSKQDFATSGLTQDFEYLVVADSHGRGFNKDYYTNMFKSLSWGVFLADETWRERLIKLCDNANMSRLIGTTFTCVKITSEHFEVTWIGDSSAKIFKDGNLVWMTKDHDYDNEEDIEKLKQFEGFTCKDAWDIQATSHIRMTSKKAKQIRIKGETTNMTRSLGHRGAFSALGFENVIIPRDEGTYKIVVGSDGFWQVMSDEDTPFILDKENSAEILTRAARNRWEQPWEHDDTMGHITKNVNIPAHNWDDVAVATWSN